MKRFFIYIFLFIFVEILSASNTLSLSTAGFYELPNTGREVYCMNPAWRFYKGVLDGEPYSCSFDDSQWQCVSLPHGIEYLPMEASGCINYQGIVWYRKHFKADNNMSGKKIFLHFEAIMGKCKVWINGILAKEHFGGYLPVIIDVTDFLKFEEENVIAVMADNSDDPSYPVGKKQSTLDYAYFGGIYRDCWLVAHNVVHITDPNYENEVAGGGLYIYSENVSENKADVCIKTHIRNEDLTSKSIVVVYELRHSNDESIIIRKKQKAFVEQGQAAYVTTKLNVRKPNLWSPESPYLYNLDIYVEDQSGNVIDGMRQRIGIRSIEFKQEKGLWINGKPYGKIMGANRHQDFAILGNAVPNSMQWRDARKLKDAGVRIIRSAHYVLDPSFMDACDELGMFVIVATPGWQFWNDEAIFGERVYSDIRNMIRQNRNRACTFLWEPILNETRYPAKFAQNAASICKEEYPFIEASCDDAAQGDDFFSVLLRPTDNLRAGKTYFVREWGSNPDDFTSQNSDNRVSREWGEVPMLVQAKHYEKIYGDVFSKDSRIVGGCLWNSFDHNRGYHPDPSYNGLMDLFRQPKTSYYMYMAQRPLTKYNFNADSGPMVYIAHEMTPFSPSDVTVFSNCEEVRLTMYKNGKVYTQKQQTQKRLPSPRFLFKDVYDFMDTKKLARANKHDECYILAEGIVGGKVVATHRRTPARRPVQLRLRLDNNGIPTMADGSDMVTVIAEVVDKNGIVKRLNNSIIKLSIVGEGRLIGDTIGCIRWGSAPFLVQSTLKAGKVRILASMQNEGIHRPLSGELVFETLPDPKKEIFLESEVFALDKTNKNWIESSQRTSIELEQENSYLRQLLNDYKIKEVDMQQREFGIGIND